MYRALENAEPLVQAHPDHDVFLPCTCFKRKILLSSRALDVFMNNLELYNDIDLDCIKYLSPHIKSLIARKFLSSRVYVNKKKVNYKKLINLMLHEKMEEIDLTLYTTDDDILKSLEVCRNLKILRIDGGTSQEGEISSISTRALIHTVGSIPELLDLRIEKCDALTDDVLIATAANCPKLQMLDLRGCRNISDEGLKALITLEKLKALDISGSKITDAGLNALVHSSFVDIVEDIRLDHCKHISEFDFGLFAAKCKRLAMFSCLGSPIADQINNLNSQQLKNMKHINWAIEW